MERFPQAAEALLGRLEAERLSADVFLVTGVPPSWSRTAVTEMLSHIHWESFVEERHFFDLKTRTRTWIARARHQPVTTRIQGETGTLIHIKKPAPRSSQNRAQTRPIRKWVGPLVSQRTEGTPCWPKQDNAPQRPPRPPNQPQQPSAGQDANMGREDQTAAAGQQHVFAAQEAAYAEAATQAAEQAALHAAQQAAAAQAAAAQAAAAQAAQANVTPPGPVTDLTAFRDMFATITQQLTSLSSNVSGLTGRMNAMEQLTRPPLADDDDDDELGVGATPLAPERQRSPRRTAEPSAQRRGRSLSVVPRG